MVGPGGDESSSPEQCREWNEQCREWNEQCQEWNDQCREWNEQCREWNAFFFFFLVSMEKRAVKVDLPILMNTIAGMRAVVGKKETKLLRVVRK